MKHLDQEQLDKELKSIILSHNTQELNEIGMKHNERTGRESLLAKIALAFKENDCPAFSIKIHYNGTIMHLDLKGDKTSGMILQELNCQIVIVSEKAISDYKKTDAFYKAYMKYNKVLRDMGIEAKFVATKFYDAYHD